MPYSLVGLAYRLGVSETGEEVVELAHRRGELALARRWGRVRCTLEGQAISVLRMPSAEHLGSGDHVLTAQRTGTSTPQPCLRVEPVVRPCRIVGHEIGERVEEGGHTRCSLAPGGVAMLTGGRG